jgi:SAM-dependent methyltransferase
MKIHDIVVRDPCPAPWAEGEKIPWNDPAFSSRMLREHLTQDHDLASRRSAIIDRQVEWIHKSLLWGNPAKVLDLGCGPGLYTSRLAERGCQCTGIDFSPASITYAREQALAGSLDCQYFEGDLRTTSFGIGYDLIIFVYGEFNVFRPQDARLILQKAYAALEPDGWLVLEPHTFDAVRQLGETASSWYTSPGGLFLEGPYIELHEGFWDEITHTTTERYYIIDAGSGEVTRYASTMQAYSEEQYRTLIQDCGFRQVVFYPSLEGNIRGETHMLMAITAKK